MLKRLSTGLTDLDLVFGGGLPAGATIVIGGPPGTGKTILAHQICFANATEEHKAIYYTTLAESHSKHVEHLAQFTFFDQHALGPKIEHIHLGDFFREQGSEALDATVAEVVRKALETRPNIIVIDSAKMLRDFVGDHELRMALYDLTSRVAHSGTVLLLLGEYTPEEMTAGVEFSLADGIVQLSYEPREPLDRRWLRVIKMRGAAHREGKHTFRIDDTGVAVFPRIESLLPLAMTAVSGRITSGIPGLDGLAGGGLPAGDAVLVLGPSGAGKTILSLRYLSEGLTHGERCMYITFQDTAEQLMAMAQGFGWDLTEARAAGQLTIAHVPMGSLDLDALAAGLREELAAGPVARVVIDSLAELGNAAREADRFPAYLRSLIGIIRAAGASLLITSETATLGPPSAEALNGLMFLFHDVIQVRYVEQDSEVGRAINIIKMRTSDHDRGIHSWHITDQGPIVGDRLDDIAGILGWSVLSRVIPA